MSQTSALAVSGLANSKASTNQDHGVRSLLTFLEKKASRKVLEHKLDGDILYISVRSSDASRFNHLNGFSFAGTTLEVEDLSTPTSSSHNNHDKQPSIQSRRPPTDSRQPLTLGGHSVSGPGRSTPTEPRNQRPYQNGSHNPEQSQNYHQNNPRHSSQNNRNFSNPPPNQHTSQNQRRQDTSNPLTPEIENTIISVLRKRYIPTDKYLNLESLAIDPEIQASGLAQLSASKFFSLLFKTIETKVFETPGKRREMVTSVSLRNLSLSTVQDVIGLAGTFPQLKNLDLSQNNISETGDLRFWRNRFRDLEHLILSDNPISTKPNTKDVLRRWYPKLQLFNNEPVRGSSTDPLKPTNAMETNAFSSTPERTSSPAFSALPTEPHPEFPPGSTFGVPVPGKSDEQLMMEQMGLKFSFETRLKMEYVEQCLVANGWDWDRAITNLNDLYEAGQITSDAFLAV